MALSHEIISQFAKIVNSDKKQNTESTVYGTVMTDSNGNKYVRLDGSDQLTPLADENQPAVDTTTANANDGDRVSVLIKNHTATVTGNMSSPAVRDDDFKDLGEQVSKIQKFDILIAEKVQATEGYIQELRTDKLSVGDFEAAKGEINELIAEKATINDLETANGKIENLESTKIDTEVANAKYATFENLNATNAEVNSLKANYGEFEELTTEKLEAHDAEFTNMNTKYASIDFSNIGEAAMKKFYADSGLIKDVTISEGNITGHLVGVKISGDLIEANTLVAKSLILQGEDGLWYELNTTAVKNGTYEDNYVRTEDSIDAVECTVIEDRVTSTGEQVYSYIDAEGVEKYCCIIDTEIVDPETSESSIEQVYYAVDCIADGIEVKQTDYNSLNGSIITAKSITATQIRVDDLSAFKADIGGFKLTEKSIYSNGKGGVDSNNSGVYLDSEGQIAFGDEHNFFRYYKDENGSFKLDIKAERIVFGAGKKFTLDSAGITVEGKRDDTNADIKTTVSNNGMKIYGNDKEMLKANDEGVVARDLHARTYLIVGDNSRFENYGNDRTGCFWIGG